MNNQNLANTINAMKDSFFTIINDPQILEQFVESMGLQSMVDEACEKEESEGVKVELVNDEEES